MTVQGRAPLPRRACPSPICPCSSEKRTFRATSRLIELYPIHEAFDVMEGLARQDIGELCGGLQAVALGRSNGAGESISIVGGRGQRGVCCVQTTSGSHSLVPGSSPARLPRQGESGHRQERLGVDQSSFRDCRIRSPRCSGSDRSALLARTWRFTLGDVPAEPRTEGSQRLGRRHDVRTTEAIRANLECPESSLERRARRIDIHGRIPSRRDTVTSVCAVAAALEIEARIP